MLALVRKRTKFLSRLLLLASLTVLGACATQKEPPRLVNDPDSKPESSLPWNKQEKWEVGGGIPGALGEGR
jgi:uncharacterized lipoprotein YajG